MRVRSELQKLGHALGKGKAVWERKTTLILTQFFNFIPS